MKFDYSTSFPITGMPRDAFSFFAYEIGVFTSALIGPEGDAWSINIEQGAIILSFRNKDDLDYLQKRLNELEFFDVEGHFGRMRQRVEVLCLSPSVNSGICGSLLAD